MSDSKNVPNILAEIFEERARQISVEGYDYQHDDEHDNGSLAMAAACYAAPDRIYLDKGYALCEEGHLGGRTLKDAWPWGREWDKRLKHSRRRQLIISAALIIAEIQRLDRND